MDNGNNIYRIPLETTLERVSDSPTSEGSGSCYSTTEPSATTVLKTAVFHNSESFMEHQESHEDQDYIPTYYTLEKPGYQLARPVGVVNPMNIEQAQDLSTSSTDQPQDLSTGKMSTAAIYSDPQDLSKSGGGRFPNSSQDNSLKSTSTSSSECGDTGYDVNVPSEDPLGMMEDINLDDTGLSLIETKDLNKLLKDKKIGKDRVSQIKKHRRTLKNRGYASSCRIKRLSHKELSERRLNELKRKERSYSKSIAETQRKIKLGEEKIELIKFNLKDISSDESSDSEVDMEAEEIVKNKPPTNPQTMNRKSFRF